MNMVGNKMLKKRRDVKLYHVCSMEATSGFEPLNTAFAEPCLTTWRRRREGERETGIEPATFSLARRCSTTEPLPHVHFCVYSSFLSFCDCMIKIPHSWQFVNRVLRNFCAC